MSSHALNLQVDYKNASPRFLGWVVAAFSFSQLIGSPFFGFWGDKRPTREPLVIALIINVIFNVLYSYCGAFPSGLASWVMLVSRAMVGFAAGEFSIVLPISNFDGCTLVSHACTSPAACKQWLS